MSNNTVRLHLAVLGKLVRAKSLKLCELGRWPDDPDSENADSLGACHVPVETVANHPGVLGLGIEETQRFPEDPFTRLAVSQVTGPEDMIEKRSQTNPHQ